MVAEEGRQCVVSVGWLSVDRLGAILVRSFFLSLFLTTRICVFGCMCVSVCTYTPSQGGDTEGAQIEGGRPHDGDAKFLVSVSH